jgi:hypothetical protein
MMAELSETGPIGSPSIQFVGFTPLWSYARHLERSDDLTLKAIDLGTSQVGADIKR